MIFVIHIKEYPAIIRNADNDPVFVRKNNFRNRIRYIHDHRFFRREGLNVYCRAPISMVTAALEGLYQGRNMGRQLVRVSPDAPCGYMLDQLTVVTNDRNLTSIPLAVEGRVEWFQYLHDASTNRLDP